MERDIREAYLQLRGSRPELRQKDIARELGLSEAEVVTARGGDEVTRLRPDWRALVEAFETLGPVMALTRNEWAVIETDGRYGDISIEGPMGQVLGDRIDLRLFLARWRSVFAVREESSRGIRRSVQTFDRHGVAAHKVHLRPASEVAAFDALVAGFADPSADQPLREPPEPPPAERPDTEIDADGLRAAWGAMTDTHQFFGLLRRFEVTRTQALRLAGPDRARQVEASAFTTALREAATREIPTMCFVGSAGVIQIHTGPVERIVTTGGWINVLDPGFNLHVRDAGVASAWVVTKPTDHGLVRSLEVFDPVGGQVLLLFGDRKAGDELVASWADLLSGLPGSLN